MLCDLARGDGRLSHDKAVAMIVKTTNLKRGQRMRPRDAADISPDTLLDLRLYPMFAMLCTENDVVKEGRICICHAFQPSLRDGYILIPMVRGLKPTAKLNWPLRGDGL